MDTKLSLICFLKINRSRAAHILLGRWADIACEKASDKAPRDEADINSWYFDSRLPIPLPPPDKLNNENILNDVNDFTIEGRKIP